MDHKTLALEWASFTATMDHFLTRYMTIRWVRGNNSKFMALIGSAWVGLEDQSFLAGNLKMS
jgi:hypothetical protein